MRRVDLTRQLADSHQEAGVTLVEIIVALGILSIVLMSLGGLMFQMSVQTRRSTALAFLSAAKQSAQTRVEGLPWDSISSPTNLGCTTDTTGQLIYSRCTTVTDVTSKLKRVRVVLTPTGNLTGPPDTVVVERTKPQSYSPFSP